MTQYENQCVGCDYCIGSSCKYHRAEVKVCDKCGEPAEYEVDDRFELCESCAQKYLKKMFDTYGIYEKAEMLDIEVVRIF